MADVMRDILLASYKTACAEYLDYLESIGQKGLVDTEGKAAFIVDRLLESGVIAPPVKAGENIWYIDKDKKVQEAQVRVIDHRDNCYHIIAHRYDYEKEDIVKVYLAFERFKKNFWLSKKEAEEALKLYEEGVFYG
ncbi:MAG: hypothetical protein UGF89_02525 [Acutalibacteraceae bacterium]|nr:hypothetical protein [Acutalibacteraceae bacterium]